MTQFRPIHNDRTPVLGRGLSAAKSGNAAPGVYPALNPAAAPGDAWHSFQASAIGGCSQVKNHNHQLLITILLELLQFCTIKN
jgi:hypothetical protein